VVYFFIYKICALRHFICQ